MKNKSWVERTLIMKKKGSLKGQENEWQINKDGKIKKNKWVAGQRCG